MGGRTDKRYFVVGLLIGILIAAIATNKYVSDSHNKILEDMKEAKETELAEKVESAREVGEAALAQNKKSNEEYLMSYVKGIMDLNDGYVSHNYAFLSLVGLFNLIDLADLTSDQIAASISEVQAYNLDGRKKLGLARERFNGLEQDAPSDFLRGDVSNRIEQISTLLEMSQKLSDMTGILDQMTYETSYRTQDTLTAQYTIRSEEYLILLEKLEGIENRVAVQWD